MQFRTIDPTTGAVVREWPFHDAAQVEDALQALDAAQERWQQLALATRSDRLRVAAELLMQRQEELAFRMASEMGKPLAEGRGEVAKCAWVCRYYADEAPAMLAAEVRGSDASESWVAYEPLGIVLAIMPWNFPLWQVFRAAAPAFMAGNAVVLKHAPSVPGCALDIAAICAEAGLPLANLFVDVDQVGALIADRRVRGVTLTGSTAAGRRVAERAGQSLKPMVLELGGSDPFIVLGDADVQAAASAGVTSRLLNAGQSCIAAKRFIVERAVAPAFEAALLEGLTAAVVGDPRDDATTVGPLARADLRDTLHAQVERAVAAGAEVVCGATLPSEAGWFYPVTLLRVEDRNNPALREELFGPVAVIHVVEDAEAAVRVANDTDYGLSASLWTEDLDRGKALARQIRAGAVFLNGMSKSDPRLPFGGVSDSGLGRELSVEGVRAFCNVKSYWVR